MSPIAKGIIITVSVLVAAGIAAYESPQVREWVERSREKIAIALHSLGDDIHPRSSRPGRDDPSTKEEQGDEAEEKRRQKRQEIMEKGRLMEERMRKRKAASGTVEISEKRSPSFDSLVDDDGKLRPHVSNSPPTAATTAIEPQNIDGSLRSRFIQEPEDQLHQSVDAPMLLRQLESPRGEDKPWESQYEQEMRNTWHLPLPVPSAVLSSHASESLIDLTPTTEGVPDPEVSIPAASDLERSFEQAEYFSLPGSGSSHNMFEAAQPECHHTYPLLPPHLRQSFENTTTNFPPSSAGSEAHVHPGDLDSEDDFSELGDGIRTPASAWTEVGSTISDDN